MQEGSLPVYNPIPTYYRYITDTEDGESSNFQLSRAVQLGQHYVHNLGEVWYKNGVRIVENTTYNLITDQPQGVSSLQVTSEDVVGIFVGFTSGVIIGYSSRQCAYIYNYNIIFHLDYTFGM